MFPGQGSQKIGMGKELFANYPQEVRQARDILGYDIIDICQHREEALNNTLYTQPALYLVNALCFGEMKSQATKWEAADYHIGHSLGEYNALLAAEVFDFSTGLKLVKKRAELMSEEKGGGMAAVLGMEKEVLEAILKEEGD